MCGVFGFIARRGEQLNLKKLERIAVNTELRGKHAFGFAWVDAHGRLHSFKQTGRISDNLAILSLAADARMLIGHCRLATHGNPEVNGNNHPHPVDGGWLVHNGIMHNYETLVQKYDLWPVSDCDSEVLGLMIEQERGDLLGRCRKALGKSLDAMSADFAMLALWARPARMLIARRGNPVHWSEDAEGYYVASLPDALRKPVALKDGTVGVFTNKDAKYAKSLATVASKAAPSAAWLK